MSLEFNVENRRANRCCSFCRRQGHNILTCNSDHLYEFENSCIIQRRSNLRIYILNVSLINSNLVRAFAIRRCGATTRSTIYICINKIVEYFNTRENELTPANNRRHNAWMNSMLLFMDMDTIISSMYASHANEILKNIKFDIKIKISDNKINLEEKCECNICYEENKKKNYVKLNCGHEFCKDCIKKTLQNERRVNPYCAFCRAEITNFELSSESIKNEFSTLIQF